MTRRPRRAWRRPAWPPPPRCSPPRSPRSPRPRRCRQKGEGKRVTRGEERDATRTPAARGEVQGCSLIVVVAIVALGGLGLLGGRAVDLSLATTLRAAQPAVGHSCDSGTSVGQLYGGHGQGRGARGAQYFVSTVARGSSCRGVESVILDSFLRASAAFLSPCDSAMGQELCFMCVRT